MKAVSYETKHRVAVSTHPKPRLQAATDALLRVTTSGICGNDLHMYHGRPPLKKGTVVGQEIMGVIEEPGEVVTGIGHIHRIQKAKEFGAHSSGFQQGIPWFKSSCSAGRTRASN
jgi:D-arabinose 1-dehydrogenase-like Zn-dependent alcohol dehydrogenase